jgi:hypothetical protein
MALQNDSQTAGTDIDRRTLNEILITAVVFGFTLNIISNFILSLPILLADPVMLIWNTGWSMGSTIVTLYLLYRLFSLYLGDDSNIEKEFRIVIIWNVEDGTVTNRATGYRPQMDAFDIFASLDCKRTEEIRQIVKAGPKALHESSLPIQLSEVLLLSTLARITSVGRGVLTPIRLGNIPHGENVFATSDLADTEIHLLGNWRVRRVIDDNQSRTFEIKWKRPFHGSASFEIGIEKVDWFKDASDERLASFDSFYQYDFTRGMSSIWKIMKNADPKIFSELPDLMVPENQPTDSIRSDIKVKFHARFSPIFLQFGWRNIKKLLPWIKGTLVGLIMLLDWPTYRQVIGGAQQPDFTNRPI